jgi:hypothetical protein
LKRWLGGPAWSPDGTRLAFCAEDQDARKVWTILADGGPPVAFPDSRCTAWGSEVPVSWAPGREILYQRDGNQNYHTLDPESGREAPLLPQPERGWAFGPRPHASDVALMWNHPDGRGVWIVRLGNPPRFLTDSVWPLAWSRDGRTIHGFNDRSGDIVAITVRTGGAHIRRTLQRLRVGLVPAITPDLEQVIYSAHAIFADVWTVKDFDPARTRRR